MGRKKKQKNGSHLVVVALVGAFSVLNDLCRGQFTVPDNRLKKKKTLVWYRTRPCISNIKHTNNTGSDQIQQSQLNKHFHSMIGTGRYTTSGTTNRYHTDFTYLIKSTIEQKRAIVFGNVSQNMREKDEKTMARNQFHTPSCTSMSLYNSLNTPNYTTSTTNRYRLHVPENQ